MKRILTLAAFLLFTCPLLAQGSLSGDIFVRPEFRHGYSRQARPDEKPAAFVNQRTRIILDFKKEKITTKVSIQDARVWGQQMMRTQVPSLDLHEAWVNVAFTDSFAIKAGRQELVYDNMRFLAHNDWLPWANKHDALMLRFLTKAGELHLVSAFNQAGNPLFGTDYPLNHYKTLNFFWFKTQLSQNLGATFLGMADGYQDEFNGDLNLRATWHTFITAKFNKLSFGLNPAFQHGANPAGQDVAAWYLLAEAGLDFSQKLSSRLGFELFSGNDATNPDDKSRVFDVPYSGGHARLGFMDYFTLNIPAQTKGDGLFSQYLRNIFRLNPKARLHADLHVFFLQNNYINENETIDKYLGTELDLTYNYSFNDMTQIVAGYSVMLGSPSMDIIKEGSHEEFAHWAYLTLRVRPKFL